LLKGNFANDNTKLEVFVTVVYKNN